MKFLPIALTLLLGACSSTVYKSEQTMELIAASEANAPHGVSGTFEFEIKGSGKVDGEVFLNTEENFRDRRSISIALSPKVVMAFIRKEGLSPKIYFLDKKIQVTGEAKRKKVFLTSNGKKMRSYFFLTEINVTSLDQIKEL
ncbi:hypothetical protein A7985_04515 [Pseudoalteromonas luteoviolacea]|uniref:Lipoprotein n=1 Tax=Pseudoalteromonas luteoviolacea TaxID=43657 RepID=A0A1C0TV64_9GAMM|nr:hypothetical protein [Pseudoalteromonas luteoviolacea]MBQ4809763.1 hypothetical protein [Pseudoalteromonas luteoviolacea]OCQ23213.1 hypothetical protein A7985_04515 [Pseudoalteromonas luteoviolacea]